MCVHVGEGAPGLQAQFLWSNRGDDMKPRPEDIPLTASAHGKSLTYIPAPSQTIALPLYPLNCFHVMRSDFLNKRILCFNITNRHDVSSLMTDKISCEMYSILFFNTLEKIFYKQYE